MAPIPNPAPISASQAGLVANPYYVRDTQDWAIQVERQHHDQAIYTLGEYSMFCLLWTLQDLEAGLVARCARCTGTDGSIQADIQAVYNQPTMTKCPECYGTTFEGGYRALLVRPAVFSDVDQAQRPVARGLVDPADVMVESTTDFRVHTGDYVFRLNGDRYQLRSPRRTMLRTGFGDPTQTGQSINYNLTRASLEDPQASVAYDIGPGAADLRALLTAGRYVPQDFTTAEVIRGPLIPTGD